MMICEGEQVGRIEGGQEVEREEEGEELQMQSK